MCARKLGRVTSHRMAMLKNLVKSLLTYGKIKTTYFKAKELEFFVGKYISLAKRDEVPTNLKSKFANRNGGFTRVIKLGPRRGDAAEMAVVELVI